jgi:hypothetical protein
MMWRGPAVSAAAATAAVLAAGLAAAQDVYRKDLKSGIDARTPGAELFLRAFEVFSHPRCSNCHPRDDRPLWGIRFHGMNVQRGEEKTGHDKKKPDGGYGRAGMTCITCHQEQNGALPGSPPGAHHWRLAPIRMGWAGLTAAELCLQFKELEHRGEGVLDHIVKPVPGEIQPGEKEEEWKIDPLVAWAWEPGPGRQPAPGKLNDFVKILMWWKEAGAPCPPK